MRLANLKIRNFRSLVDVELTLDDLAVLIGENDAGKSSVLDVLEIVLNDGRPEDSDFCTLEDVEAETVEVVLEFDLEEKDSGVVPRAYSRNGKLIVRYVYTRETATGYYRGERCVDGELNQNFSNLNKPELEALIGRYGGEEVRAQHSNNSQRQEWLSKYVDTVAPKQEDWMQIPSRWEVALPRFERYRAIDYKQPENMILKTLRQVFEEVIFEEESDGDGSPELIRSLREVHDEADRAIQEKVAELQGFVQRYNDKVLSVTFAPQIDFSGALKTGQFMINDGRGPHYLDKTGDGTKRRLLMAVLDWDRQVTVEQLGEGVDLPTVIRGYDEPDTNLHYEAQHQMFAAITDIVRASNSNVQALVCTHSLTLIDRAPAKSIRALKLEGGRTRVDALDTDQDEEIEEFLSDLARELGITNTLMFYERCLVLIAGETEENALPILYKRRYEKSVLEDGIRLISVRGNGALKEFLKLLSKNKKECVVIFTDREMDETDEARLTEESLREAGFDDAFISERLRYVGEVEFEDAFTNEDIVACLEKHWPRREGAWTEDQIETLRGGEGKFSTELVNLVARERDPDKTELCRKPVLGKHLARHCSLDNIPTDVAEVFDLARSVAGTN
jgi:predicted ATPase